MNKEMVVNAFKAVQSSVTKHSPEILTGIGIAGMITTTVLAVKATPKALELINSKKEEEQTDKLTPVEVIKTTWQCYIPAAVLGVVSAGCLIGSSSVSVRRNAALATAYKLSETAFNEYREQVIETIGEKKEQVVKEKIDKRRMENNPVTKSEVIMTGNGETLCYDSTSGRYFKSSIEKIKKAVNEINRQMLLDMYVSLNELYDELDLDHTSVGEYLGWNIDDKLIDLDFTSQIATDGTPCIVMNFTVPPHYDFSKFA